MLYIMTLFLCRDYNDSNKLKITIKNEKNNEINYNIELFIIITTRLF